MSIKDFTEKIKPFWTSIKERLYSFKNSFEIKDDLFIVLLIGLVGTASFSLGRLSSLEEQKTPISVIQAQETASVASAVETNPANTNQKGTVFSSKSGSKYYYPWCSGASRIKEENRVWFNSIEEAKSRGLSAAANCPGLN